MRGNCEGHEGPCDDHRVGRFQLHGAFVRCAFYERVRREEFAVTLPGDARAAAARHRFDVAYDDFVWNGSVAQRERRHDSTIVRRRARAILRTMNAHRALVVSTGKNAAWVVLDDESEPRLAQLRRMTGKRSMPLPGDIVYVQSLEDGKTVLERIEPRSQLLERRTFDGRTKTIAANVETLVTVTALASPPPRLVTLDQLLAFARLQDIEGMVVLTKPDLADEADRLRLVEMYENLGYRTIVVNPKSGSHVDELREAIAGRHALLCGVSGVGKSSIFRALGGSGSVGEVSRYGVGRQTTSAARLYRMGDGFLIDSPGINEFGLGAITSGELVHGFREMVGPAADCRFSDCTHLREPDCAVQEAVNSGKIAESRYQSYRRILLDPT